MKRPLALCASCIVLAAAVLLLGGQAGGSERQAAQAASATAQPQAPRNESSHQFTDQPPAEDPLLHLTPPADGRITVAVVVAPDAEVVDFSGPWGVFEYANIPNLDKSPFELFTVAETSMPVKCSGGLTIVPDHTFASAPKARIILIPAMGEPSPALLAWVKESAKQTDVTMSVCNGSFVLAQAGLLAGKTVTCHHGGYGLLAANYPDVTVKRGARFVDDGRISTAGGLTSGIDLALHIVERYYGRAAAEQTALDLEYQGTGWKDPNSNFMFAAAPVTTDEHPVCPICEMAVDKKIALSEVYKGRTVYFCGKSCQELFDKSPQKYVKP